MSLAAWHTTNTLPSAIDITPIFWPSSCSNFVMPLDLSNTMRVMGSRAKV
jgi:hypothetical protein